MGLCSKVVKLLHRSSAVIECVFLAYMKSVVAPIAVLLCMNFTYFHDPR